MTKAELNQNFINNNLLPVCAWCGLVRDKQNKWQKVNIKKLQYAKIRLTHGICPDCINNLY